MPLLAARIVKVPPLGHTAIIRLSPFIGMEARSLETFDRGTSTLSRFLFDMAIKIIY
jgi:hypothetical protein